MSCFHATDRELFDKGVLIRYRYDKTLRCELQGLYRLKDTTGLYNGETFIPCVYKKILSYKNGFARVITITGNMIYVRDDGEKFFDQELPFIPELCSDFDKNGKASIACLIEGVLIVRGYMDREGEMFFNYNS